ncbi:MAG: hypothetical protein VKL39_24705, partial [Leptolyngbyaceae bacterium]|nr:hypothetical protein [Leptolyngbyaceae bacterium]
RVLRIASALGVTHHHAIGLVYALYSIAQTSGPTVGTPQELDQLMGQPGFAAALPEDWYAIEDGQIVLQSSRKPVAAAAKRDAGWWKDYRAKKRGSTVQQSATVATSCSTVATELQSCCSSVAQPVAPAVAVELQPSCTPVANASASREAPENTGETHELGLLQDVANATGCNVLQASCTDVATVAHPVSYSSSLIKDNIVKPNTEENTGGEEGSGEKRGIAAKDPELFEQYVAMWKRLHKSGFVATSLADPPGRYVVEAWNRAQKDADRRPLLQDIDAIEKAARGAYFAHGQGWFSPDWLLGKKAGQIPNVAKLLRGDLEGRHANGKMSDAELRRQRGHDLSTVTW